VELIAMRARRLVVVALAVAGVVQLLQGGWIEAKAWLARGLLEQAWQTSLVDGAPARPWPWADTWPVARLTVPTHGVERLVLHGASGRTLAFGPAWDSASAPPGGPGLVLFSGHRDTHFRFLADLRPGDELRLAHPGGEVRYRVEGAEVFDTRNSRLVDHDGSDRLLLVTCYPFDSLVPGGPLRYAVSARAVVDDGVPGRGVPGVLRAGVRTDAAAAAVAAAPDGAHRSGG
jgi:sortase A